MTFLLKRQIILTFLLVIFFVGNTINSSATNIGVSPGVITFDQMLRGGYAQRDVTVGINTNKNVYVTLEPYGAIKDWLEVSENVLLITPEKQQAKIQVIIRPPDNVPNGPYQGGIKFKTSGLGDIVEGQVGTVVSAAVDLVINIGITDVQIIQCRARSFTVNSAEIGEDIVFGLNVANDGNVLLTPQVTIDIWDQEQKNIVAFLDYNEASVLQTSEQDMQVILDSATLSPGQYWAEVSVPVCLVEDFLLTFDILEEGALSAEGVITTINAPVWIDKDQTFPINVIFKNTGEKAVDAYFKGQISRGDKILEILESDELRVPKGENVSFDFFYSAKDIGRHVISGKVFYEKKRTFEGSAVFNVRESEAGSPWGIILAVIVTLILAYFVWKIRQGKKKKPKFY